MNQTTERADMAEEKARKRKPGAGRKPKGSKVQYEVVKRPKPGEVEVVPKEGYAWEKTDGNPQLLLRMSQEMKDAVKARGGQRWVLGLIEKALREEGQ